MLKRPLTLGIALLVALGAIWLFTPGESRFRTFDPEAVGGAEAQLWRAYYERRRIDLASGLMLNAQRDFGLSPFDSIRAGLAAADAARTFQASRSRAEAQRALPSLTRYFETLRGATHSDFDPAEAARLELEWWQLRREVNGPERYAPAVAAATAYVYGVAPDALVRYAVLRSEAMDLRDSRRDAVTDEDWSRIEALLTDAYRALRAELSDQPPVSRESAAW
jgi:hypothetical protein